MTHARGIAAGLVRRAGIIERSTAGGHRSARRLPVRMRRRCRTVAGRSLGQLRRTTTVRRARATACLRRGRASGNRHHQPVGRRPPPQTKAGHRKNAEHDDRSDHAFGHAERPQAGLQRDGPRASSRSAFSPVIAEAHDRSDGIYHRDDGALIAQGELGPAGLRRHHAVHGPGGDRAREPRRSRSQPGDVFIVNDPYLGGTHLMDVRSSNRSSATASSAAGSPTPATGPTSAAWCRAAFRRTPPSRAGGAAPAAGQVVQEGRARRGNPRHHPVQHPHRRPAHRRHQGAGGGARDRRGAALRPARPLRRRTGRRRDRRAARARGAADAREDRDHSRRNLRGRGDRRLRRRRRRAAADQDEDHQSAAATERAISRST